MTRCRAGAAIVALVLGVSPAGAVLSPEALASVGVAPGGALPDLVVPGLAGSVRLGEVAAGTVVALADFDCAELCDAALADIGAAVAAERAPLLVIGIDPGDTAATAAAFVGRTISAGVAVTVARPDAAARDAIAAALGIRFVYDAVTNRYAHPAAALVIGAGGRVVRALSAIGLARGDLALALGEARGARVSLRERLILACYHFDATGGRYAFALERLLMVLSLATVAGLALTIAALVRRERRVPWT